MGANGLAIKMILVDGVANRRHHFHEMCCKFRTRKSYAEARRAGTIAARTKRGTFLPSTRSNGQDSDFPASRLAKESSRVPCSSKESS